MTDSIKQRSLKQNKYRWGVVVKAYQEWLNMAIKSHNENHSVSVSMLTPDDVDFYIKDVVWGLVERTNWPWGVVTREFPLRGTDVSTFEERMEQARAFAAQELHLEIPLPREDIRDLEEQYKYNLERV